MCSRAWCYILCCLDSFKAVIGVSPLSSSRINPLRVVVVNAKLVDSLGISVTARVRDSLLQSYLLWLSVRNSTFQCELLCRVTERLERHVATWAWEFSGWVFAVSAYVVSPCSKAESFLALAVN
jgi:hypothetical protein